MDEFRNIVLTIAGILACVKTSLDIYDRLWKKDSKDE